MFFIAPDCAGIDECAVSLEMNSSSRNLWLKAKSIPPYLEGSHRHVGQQVAQVNLCCAGGGELTVEVSAELAQNLIAFSFFYIWVFPKWSN